MHMVHLQLCGQQGCQNKFRDVGSKVIINSRVSVKKKTYENVLARY